MAAVDPKTKRVIRGAILRLAYQKHERQEHRFETRTLLAALDDLGFHVYENLVDELIQDLGDSGYLNYRVQVRDRKAGERTSVEIQLTPAGRKLVEGLTSDASVDV